MSTENRRLLHTRTIQVQAYQRGDQLCDLEAHLVDTKGREWMTESGLLPVGAPLHEMWLNVTIDRQLNIVAASARTLAAPFQQTCASFPEVYQRLVGLNLLSGFRAAVRERLGGTQGCTHITELANVLPTAAVQAFAHEIEAESQDADVMPSYLDGCRALRLDGPVVEVHYPRWFRREGEKKA